MSLATRGLLAPARPRATLRAKGGDVSGLGGWGARVRWAWLVTTLGLSAVLIGSAWGNHRSAIEAADDLIRGQAQIFRDIVIATNRTRSGQPRADFDSLVTAQAEAGLRYLAWVRQDGVVLANGGHAAAVPLEIPPVLRDPTIIRLGSRIRAWLPPPRPPERRGPDDRPPPPGEPDRGAGGPAGPDGGPPQPPRAAAILLLEFEPIVAAAIVSRAVWSLTVSGIVAAVLSAAGLLFWRISQRMEEAERRMEEHRRLSALGEMSAVLAHEIRNPLASLKGHAQLLLERTSAESVERRKVERVVDEAKRLEALTTDLLDFARSGPMDLRPTDPVALLRAAAAEVTESPVEIDGTAAPQRWLLDQRRFGHAVLANLLRNAVQASPPGRPPRVHVSLENGSLVYTIRDFGPGLPDGTGSRIFDPFFTTRTTGTGLGLPVARRIVELHGGRISAADASDGDRGAVFRIELPSRSA